MIGAWLGGVLADRLGAKDLRAYVSIPGLACLATLPFYIAVVSLDHVGAALILLALPMLLNTLWYGPVYATVQSIAPGPMRATASAVLLFIINLIGLGLGPLAVGLLSDLFAGPLGLGEAQGVRWALIVSTLAGLAAFALFWAARRTIRQDMAD